MWGDNDSGQLGTGNEISYPVPTTLQLPHRIKGVRCGAEHTVALTVDGAVFTWGNGLAGKLGGAAVRRTHSPNPTAARWRAGHASEQSELRPRKVEGLPQAPFAYICAGPYNSGAPLRYRSPPPKRACSPGGRLRRRGRPRVRVGREQQSPAGHR